MKTLERFQAVLLISGIGFFLVSFLGMGIAPWTTLRDLRAPEGFSPLNAQEQRGRQIFIQEGCWHCHTQFVRPVAHEELRYGPVSDASEYLYEIPQLFGTRRVGPDLAREAGKRPDDWQLAHLYNPRYTVPWSIMPGFPWLFEEKDGKVVPTDDAKALVAYLQSLGRLKLPIMQAHEASFRKTFRPGTPPLENEAMVRRGKELFLRECSGCHGVNGDGFTPTQQFLSPPAQDLSTVRPTAEYVFELLNLGIPGSAMPNFRDYPAEDLWAIAFYVKRLYRKPVALKALRKTPEMVERGKALYESMCITCHGPEGRGDGPAARGLKPAPANFHRLRPTIFHTFNTLKTGIPGTAMVAYKNLSEQDRWALSYYVDELIGGVETETEANL